MRSFDVDLPGLLGVLGGHLYADAGVFVRELVQNAHDAIVERRRGEPGHVGRVAVRGDEAAGVVEIDDDGVGLDADGIALALGRIGWSSKRGGSAASDGVLGRFGIGLLSGFLVARELRVETRRAGAEAVRWIATPDGKWRIEAGARERVGTTVRLVLTEAHARFARREVLAELLERYVHWLPMAVELDGARVTAPAPWLAEDAVAATTAWLRARGEEPLSAVPIATARARGVVWIHGRRAEADAGRVDVYLGGMLLERGARGLLPRWAGFASAALEAPALSPTASRETFVDDEAAAALRDDLRAALLAHLSSIAKEGGARLADLLRAHHPFLRAACAESPELLDALGDRLPFETNHGDVNLPSLLEVNAGERTLRYVETPQEFAHVAPLATARGLALVNASYQHDAEFLAAWAARRGVRLVRMTLDELALLVRPASAIEDARFARALAAAREALAPLDVAPELGRFEPAALPAFLVADAAQLRERARALARTSGSATVRSLLGSLALARGEEGTRFVLNVDNPVVAALPEAGDESAGRVARLLYVQAAMLLRRTLSLAESRCFSEDLLALLTAAGPPLRRGPLN
jgi:molecular chaperone HtpG